jgi:hypothetical protein
VVREEVSNKRAAVDKFSTMAPKEKGNTKGMNPFMLEGDN